MVEIPEFSSRTAIILLIACGLSVASLHADDEVVDPPTLKLDRIPSAPAFIGQTRAPAADSSHFDVQTLASGLHPPWALTFLPDGDILITENVGNMRILDSSGQVSAPLTGLPEISRNGWGGLFDVALDPEFETNRWIYFSYGGVPGETDAPNIPQVARGRLDRDGLRVSDVEILLDGTGRQELHFAADQRLLVTGAGIESDDAAQDLTNTYGKMLRINRDGSPAADNPWISDATIPGEIYSFGHRDISGMATHPETGETWATEHGPRGGDELNIIRGAPTTVGKRFRTAQITRANSLLMAVRR